jgi:hypothetical protein
MGTISIFHHIPYQIEPRHYELSFPIPSGWQGLDTFQSVLTPRSRKEGELGTQRGSRRAGAAAPGEIEMTKSGTGEILLLHSFARYPTKVHE